MIKQSLLDYFNGNIMPAEIWYNKYRLGEEETPKDMFHRHAKELATIELKRLMDIRDNDKKLDLLSQYGKKRFSNLLNAEISVLDWIETWVNFNYSIPGGSGLQGIGNRNIFSSLSNCFVMGQPFDSYSGINKKEDELTQVMKRRGGGGLDLSTIRPNGAKVQNQAKYSSGVVLFADGYSNKTKQVAQDARRGALMLTLHIMHPDSKEFIESKQDLTKITGANISVKIPDEFMVNMLESRDILLRFPIDSNTERIETDNDWMDSLPYNELIDVNEKYSNLSWDNVPQFIKKINSKELWQTLIHCAWSTAEPGILFIGNWERGGTDWSYPQYRPVSTNPCFAGHTPTLTKKGYFPIVDLVGQKIEIWNGHQWSFVEPRITGENQEMLKITLSNGAIIECTEYHPWPIWLGFSRGGKEIEKQAKELNIGDKLSKFELPVIEFGEELAEKFAYTQGFYCGDGTESRNQVYLYGEKIKLKEYLLGQITSSKIKENHYGTEYCVMTFDEKMFNKTFVPNKYSIKTRLTWLSGYIDADGTIDEVGGCQITSTNAEVINNVRLMLETLGIQANINDCHKEGIKSLPDQKGGRVDVYCKATKRVLIRSLDMQKLLKMGLKTYRCDFTKFKPKRNAARFITIKNIEKIPNAEKVYCFNEPFRHRGTFNGIVLGQCSELPMQPYDSCRLVSQNMLTFVDNPYTSEAKLNFDRIYDAFYEQLIIADIIVDLEAEYIDNIINKITNSKDPEDLKQSELELWIKVKNETLKGRRCGAGFLAMSDMLAALGKPFCSPDIIEKVFKTKLRAELDATTDLSILFGPFDGFSSDIELKSEFIVSVVQGEFPKEFKRMMKFGRRNVSWSTGAPTGSLSTMTQTTSGIEPLFMPWYKRRKKCMVKTDRVDYIDPADGQKFTEYFILHEQFRIWMHIAHKLTFEHIDSLDVKELMYFWELSPWHNQTANDIPAKDRIQIQQIVQRYTTQAISSTINLPEDVKQNVVNDIYVKSWFAGLKGNTIYREGCRAGILVSSENNKNEQKTKTKKRPIILPAKYHSLKSCGKLYSIILGFLDDKPFEVFIVSGLDNLPEIIDENEVIDGTIIKDNKEWYNFSSKTFFLKDITDMEHEEKLISLMISGLLRNNTKLTSIIKILHKTKPIAGSFTHKLTKILSKYITNGEITGETCIKCGEKLIFEDGCMICPACRWTKC